MTQAFLLFGATGDLAKKKIIPALNKLNRDFHIICFGRKELTTEKNKNISYRQFDLENKKIDLQLPDSITTAIIYLATPSQLFAPIISLIKDNLKIDYKIAIEKPFGFDFDSAMKLDQELKTLVPEENKFFRIDHYLGKALVQDILIFRFANAIFEQIWNSKFIDHVQITVNETIGIEERAAHYDKSGAIRDMLQNHLLQMLALIAMEPPKSMNPDDIHNQKVTVLKQIIAPIDEDIVIGQYQSYQQEKNVPSNSNTETFIATKILLNSSRWENVPFYLRSGKKMAKSYAEINIVLKDVSCQLIAPYCSTMFRNVITIRVQPDTGVAVKFNTKNPAGLMGDLVPVNMDFCHRCLFHFNTPEAYEYIILALEQGDSTVFTRLDFIMQAWSYVDLLLKNKKNQKPIIYPDLSNGPQEALKLIKKSGHHWIE